MSDPSEPSAALWERLRSAQDQALAARGEDAATERALLARMAGPSRASRWRLRLALGAMALSAAALVVGWASLRRPARPIAGATPAASRGARASAAPAAPPTADPPTLVAEAGSELPLRFPDGSTITFLPGSSGQVLRREAASAEVEIRGGRLEAHVVHAPGVRWVVRAGPFRVNVTGTRFGVDWSAATGVLAVTLREGSVVVDGGVLGAGVPLRAGQTLRVGLDGVVRTESADPSARATADWRALADRGAYREALRAAERGGLEAQLAALDARGLLALGDVARYAGAPEVATRTFERLVARFPHHRLAADAVFSLGRLGFENGRAARAAGWFARYVRRWPDGPLAEQAAGRLVESTARAGQVAAARRAARDYLQRAPQGTYAALARSILDGDPAETAGP